MLVSKRGKESYRKRRISGLEFAGSPFGIDRVESSGNHFDQNLVLLDLRDCDIVVKLQHVDAAILGVGPCLHFRWHDGRSRGGGSCSRL